MSDRIPKTKDTLDEARLRFRFAEENLHSATRAFVHVQANDPGLARSPELNKAARQMARVAAEVEQLAPAVASLGETPAPPRRRSRFSRRAKLASGVALLAVFGFGSFLWLGGLADLFDAETQQVRRDARRCASSLASENDSAACYRVALQYADTRDRYEARDSGMGAAVRVDLLTQLQGLFLDAHTRQLRRDERGCASTVDAENDSFACARVARHYNAAAAEYRSRGRAAEEEIVKRVKVMGGGTGPD